MIYDFIKKFTNEEIGQIVKIRDSYYLVNEELMNVVSQIKENPQQIGVYLGEDDKPSLALIDEISKKSDRKLFVDEKGEFLFICGRDLMGQSIKKSNVKEGLVLVQNIHDENLGYGRIIGELNKKDTIVVKNLLDRGDFLRREMRKKQ